MYIYIYTTNNDTRYYDVVQTVEPKRRSLADAEETYIYIYIYIYIHIYIYIYIYEETYRQANERLAQVKALVADLEATLAQLIADFDKAMAEKEAVMAEATKCKTKLDLAHRLVDALSANGVIWEQTVEKTAEDLVYIPGHALVACSFASYVA